MTEPAVHPSTSYADALRGSRHVFIQDLILDSLIGIYEHEKNQPQKLIININLNVREDRGQQSDRLESVVCYEQVVRDIQKLNAEGHINLVETFAERIAELCLRDKRVLAVRVRVAKPQAFDECKAVGIEIERLQNLSA